jgi:two-component system response regulator
MLLIEDKPADAELIMRAIADADPAQRVRLARDGAEALDLLFAHGADIGWTREPRPRLIILDIKLPKVDGIEVLRALKADPRTRAIPVVMLTSSIVERDVAQCYSLGVNGYIQKPMHFDEMRAAVAQLCAYWLKVNVAPPPSAFTSAT